MDSVDEKDCNAKELARLLVGSIQRLLDLNQWNKFTRLQAVYNPMQFIDEVAKHCDNIEKEEDSVGNFHLRITGITEYGKNNKIVAIKALRELMGWGLADSKCSFEALPNNGNKQTVVDGFCVYTQAYPSMDALMYSRDWETFNRIKDSFVFDTPRLPVGTLKSSPMEIKY